MWTYLTGEFELPRSNKSWFICVTCVKQPKYSPDDQNIDKDYLHKPWFNKLYRLFSMTKTNLVLRCGNHLLLDHCVVGIAQWIAAHKMDPNNFLLWTWQTFHGVSGLHQFSANQNLENWWMCLPQSWSMVHFLYHPTQWWSLLFHWKEVLMNPWADFFSALLV